MLKDALTLLGPHLASGAVSAEIEPDAPTCALVDRRLFVHVLVNLLKNAAEAAAERGREPEIRVSLGGDANSTRVILQDNGPGIPAALRSRIFDFGVSTKGAGRGRGLAIVRESVESQGGRIEVSSTSDAGTTFTLTFPRADPPSAIAR
jgi:C4-dicarboxylate-specific signal transduction histidine kinase